MPNLTVIAVEPPKPEKTITISGLTETEYTVLLRCLRYCSGGRLRDLEPRTHEVSGISIPGMLYNRLASAALHLWS